MGAIQKNFHFMENAKKYFKEISLYIAKELSQLSKYYH
jgi:hypothetical protein